MTISHSQPIIDWFFEEDGAENLGAAAGLDPETSRRVLAQGLPRQLQAILDHAQTPEGEHQISEAVRIIPNFPDVNTALTAGEGAADLERAGDSMAPTLLREHRGGIADRVANQTGANRAQIGRLFDMTLPLILSRLSWRDAHALAFLPLMGKVAPSAAPLIPTNAAVPAHSVARTVARVSEEKRGGFPLWLLPLLLLLLLGGCWVLRPKAPATPATTTTNATTSSGFNIETPAPASEVSANGFKVSGTGKAGDVVTMFRSGLSVGTFTVDQDGKWSADVLDAAAPVGDVAYQFRNAAGGLLGTLPLKVSGTEAAPLVLSAPKANSEVPAGGFSIAGQGKAGEVYQTYEDGTNIGSFTVAPDGTWSVDVPGPAAGNHTYTILDSKGNRVLLLPLNVVSGGSAEACTDAPTISVADNETVSAPFRFGGRGSAGSYTVTVWRGDRQVGTKEVKLTGDCTWSYQSNPGGQDGVKSVVRYELRPTGEGISTPAAEKVTLTVSGSGSNFNSKGEYVGPTK